MNFKQHLMSMIPTYSEANLHPHAAEERGELFRCIDGCTAELETLCFLNALVCLIKPTRLLETGTLQGYTAYAIAAAIDQNGFGHLDSIEIDPEMVQNAQRNIPEYLQRHVTLHQQDSMEFIKTQDSPYDFALFDSDITIRHLEFAAMMRKGLLAPRATVVFHDTSRFREGHDNQNMIDALDLWGFRQHIEFDLARGLRVARMMG